MFSLLHEVTGGWTVPFVMVLAVFVTQMAFSAFAGPHRYI